MEIESSKESDDRGVTIGLKDVFKSLLNNLYILILSTLIGTMLGYLYSSVFITPEYSSTTKLYVLANKQDEKSDEAVNNGDLQAGALLTKDYEQIIESPEVIDSVINNLKLYDQNDNLMTYNDLISHVNVSIPDETRVVKITVTDAHPYQACDIANAIREASKTRIENLLDVNSVRTVSAASIPVNPTNIHKTHNMMIGGLLGLVLAVDLVIIFLVSDNKIRTRNDIQDYLGVSVLAVIPKSETLEKSDDRYKRRKKKEMRNAEN